MRKTLKKGEIIMAISNGSKLTWSDIRNLFDRVNSERNRFNYTVDGPRSLQNTKIESSIPNKLVELIEGMKTNSFIVNGTSINSVSSFSVTRDSTITFQPLASISSLLTEIERIQPWGSTGTPQVCTKFLFNDAFREGFEAFNSAHAEGYSGGFRAPTSGNSGFNGEFGTYNGSVTGCSMECSSGFAFEDYTGNGFIAFTARQGTFESAFGSGNSGYSRGTFKSAFTSGNNSFAAGTFKSAFTSGNNGFTAARGTTNNNTTVGNLWRRFTNFEEARGTFESSFRAGNSGYVRGTFESAFRAGNSGFAAGTFKSAFTSGDNGFAAARGTHYADAFCGTFDNGRGNGGFCSASFYNTFGSGGGTFNASHGGAGTFNRSFQSTGTFHLAYESGCTASFCQSHTYGYSGNFNSDFCLSGFCASGFCAADYFSTL